MWHVSHSSIVWCGLVAEFGLFFADEDQKKGIWLENNRNLEYYLLRSGVSCCFSWRYFCSL